MNKADLIEVVSARLGDRRAASTAVEAVVDAITRAVAKGEKVGISGFGVFEPVDRAARTARNPTTGEAVRLERTRIPKFRPGQGFKDIVSGAKEVDPVAGVRAVTARAGVPRAPRPSAGEAPSAGRTAAAARSASASPARSRARAASAGGAPAGSAGRAATRSAAPARGAGSAPSAGAGRTAASAPAGRTVAAPGARSSAAAKAPGKAAAVKAAAAQAPAKAGAAAKAVKAAVKAPGKRTSG